MSRDNYNEGYGHMGNNHDQNQMVKTAAREVGVSEIELSKYIHSIKDDWYDGDFTYPQLLELAQEVKASKKNR